MATNLSNHFRRQRIALRMRPGQVARLLGYRSVVGAANKIVRFEETGDIDRRLFQKLAAVLFIDKATIKRLMEKDRRELVQRWHEWANQRIRPHLIEEVAPGIYMVHCLPEDVTTPDQMENYAADLAGTVRQPIWLIFSRKLAVYFDHGGRKRAVHEAAPGEPTEPYRRFRQGRPNCLFNGDGDDIDVRSIRWPQRHGPGVGR